MSFQLLVNNFLSEEDGRALQKKPFRNICEWWANIIKWTRTNIGIYLDATLCTEWIFKYIWMQHIYRTNIQIYSLLVSLKAYYSRNTLKGTFVLINIIWTNFMDVRSEPANFIVEELLFKLFLLLSATTEQRSFLWQFIKKVWGMSPHLDT